MEDKPFQAPPTATQGLDALHEQQQRAAAASVERLLRLLNATAATPTHINAVTIVGANVTRPSFLETATSKLMGAKHVADVVNYSQDIGDKLQRLDIFDHVRVVLDRATDSDPLAAPDSVNVVYQVKEKSRFFIKTGTEIGNNEGNMNGSITVRNCFGGAETLESIASFGTRNSSAFQFALSRPINADPDQKIDINAHHVLQNNMLTSSYEELARGTGLRYRGVSKYGYHELSYDCTWRSIDKVAENASLSIRNQAGHTLKSSITHTFMRDMRDSLQLPTHGYYLKWSQELSGIMGIGNAQFFKTELQTQFLHQIGGGELLKDKETGEWLGVHPGVVLSLGLRGGLLADYSDNAKASIVSDKFMLGGPLSIRGFRNAGIGPRDYKDALGGSAYWAIGLSAMAPLPGWESKPLRAHAFLNVGTLVPWETGMSMQDSVALLKQSPSTSVGLGLIYQFSLARLELNYCIPVTAARGDQVRRGLQLGIGIDFL